MTAPITGPYVREAYLWDIPEWSGGSQVYKKYIKKQVWYRQAKPFDLPLAFWSITRNGSSRYDSKGPYGTFYGSWTDALAATPDSPEERGDIYNQAYAKFVDKKGAAVELGIATAEGRQAMSMVTRRLLQMASFTRNLSRLQFGKAAESLGLTWDQVRKKLPKLPKSIRPKSKRGREAMRDFSSLYLEFHFGWSPLVKDIYDALEVLDKPLKPHRIKASHTGSFKDSLNFSSTSSDADWNYIESRDGSYVQTLKLQADLIITNPNLAMMQQTGLINPFKIAWELVPFSFVLDWFVTVGDYLGSITDFVGVELLNAHRTIFTRYTGKYSKLSVPKQPTQRNSVTQTWEAQTVHCIRRLGLGTGPTIRLRAPKPWGIRRGLAAASLLMQSFPRQVIDKEAISLFKKRTAFRANVFPSFNGKYY